MRGVSWTKVVALCALLCSAGSVLADEPLESDGVAMAAEMPENVGVEAKQKEGVLMEVNVKKNGVDDSKLMKEDEGSNDQEDDKMEKLKAIEKAYENKLDEEEAKMLTQPGMRRLARYLHNFHGRQIFHANAKIFAARRASASLLSDEDGDEIAEERAIRRRTRIRRRNSKNKVKRRQHNRNEANRKKTSRRKQNNRSSVRRKNSNRSSLRRKQNRKNSSVRRNTPRRQSSATNRRTIRKGTRKNSNSNMSRKSSKQQKKNKKNKMKKKNNKNKNKNKKQRRPNRSDAYSGRKDDSQDAPLEEYEEPLNAVESPAA